MDSIVPFIITGMVSLIVGYALKFLEPRSRIVWWSPHQFWYTVDITTDQPPIQLYTHSISIQNMGRKPAEQIEIAHEWRPDHFKLQPQLDYEEVLAPDKTHIIRIGSLAPKEFFSLEFLSYKSNPTFLYVRSKDGPAVYVTGQRQQTTSKFIQVVSAVCLLTGMAFILYWIVRAIMFVSAGL